MDLQPPCAQPCIASAMLAVGCKVNDQSCGCQPALQQSIGDIAASCLVKNCPSTQLLAIGNAGKAGCAAYSLTYMYSNGLSTMATMSLTSSFPLPTSSYISSSSSASSTSSLSTGIKMSDSSSTTSPTHFPTPTSHTNLTLPPSKLSTATIAGVVIVGAVIFCTLALAFFCCLRHRRVNLRYLRRSDSELFTLINPPEQELETKSIRHEMLDCPFPSPELSWVNHNRTSIYELSSEESLLRQPAEPPRVKRRSQDELDELFQRDVVVLGKEEKSKAERRPPKIVVYLAEASEDGGLRRPGRLRKVEKVSSLRELKLVKSLEGR